MQFLIYILCQIRAFVARNEFIFEISDKIWIVSSIQNSEAIGRTKNRNIYKGNVIRVGKFSHCAALCETARIFCLFSWWKFPNFLFTMSVLFTFFTRHYICYRQLLFTFAAFQQLPCLLSSRVWMPHITKSNYDYRVSKYQN